MLNFRTCRQGEGSDYPIDGIVDIFGARCCMLCTCERSCWLLVVNQRVVMVRIHHLEAQKSMKMQTRC